MYNVVYLWQGERHLGPQCSTLADAYRVRADFLADGWQAWVEAVTR